LPISFQVGADFKIKSFLKGYGKALFTPQELRRIKMYALSQGLWEIWATETQAFPYEEKELNEGKQLVQNSLKLQKDGSF
jgi:hypothetical protein